MNNRTPPAMMAVIVVDESNLFLCVEGGVDDGAGAGAGLGVGVTAHKVTSGGPHKYGLPRNEERGNVERDDGMAPDRLLLATSKNVRLACFTDRGMLPENELFRMLNK